MKKIRIVRGFSKVPHNALRIRAARVLGEYFSHEAFKNSPVSRDDFAAALQNYSDAILEAQDGAISKRAARDAARKVVTDYLVLMAAHAEFVAQGDPEILLSSGFEVSMPSSTAAPDYLSPPKIRKLFLGPYSGDVSFYITALDGATSYVIRYAFIENEIPGDWTEVPISKVKQASTVHGLTLGKRYAFQVKALGDLGYSGWCDSVTIMCASLKYTAGRK